MNTFLEKNAKFITYKSEGRESEIELLVCRRQHLKEVKDRKVINGESITAQYSLEVMDCRVQKGRRRRPEIRAPRIKW